MRVFIYIDVAIQTFILSAVIFFSVIMLVEGSIESIGLIAMYGAIFLGPWQMLSSVLTCALRSSFLKLRVIHLISAIAYLTLLSLIVAFTNKEILNGVVGRVLGFGIPAALAVFYYNITVKTFRIVRAK